MAVAGVLLLGIGVALGVAIEALVRVRLVDEQFTQPTRLFARPTTIEPGGTVDRASLQAGLERLGYRLAGGATVGIGEFRWTPGAVEIGRRAFRFDRGVEPPAVVTVRLTSGGVVRSIDDAAGQPVHPLVLEPEPLPGPVTGPREDRVPIPLEDIPEHLVGAVLAIEDQRFFDHHGLDFIRIGGAGMANLRAGRVVQGGSTLSQQLVKNLYLSSRRTISRKVRETAMAVVLENRYDKSQILTAYLNHVYLGQNGGSAIHGVGRAAQFYFGKDVTVLDLAESALLAAVIRGPSQYNPFRNAEVARERRDLVLAVMHESGLIDETAYEAARSTPLHVRERPEPLRTVRYFVDYVASRTRDRYGDAVLGDGTQIVTTLDMGLQLAAERAVRDGLVSLERQHQALRDGDDPIQAALVALDPRRGDILAMVGGRDYGTSQFNRAVDARRQPGSAFKPIVALAALAYEDEFTLATILDDDTLAVDTPTGTWRPANYDGMFRGPVTIREALERSLNVPFARLGLAVGLETIAEVGHRLGIAGELRPVPSLALGASEVTPLELTRAFAVLAAGGYRADLRETLVTLAPDGSVRDRPEPNRVLVVDGAVVYLVTSALEGVVVRGTGRGLRAYDIATPVAAKSGTTNDSRDAWFLAYTPKLVVGVWVGFDDGRSVGLSGSRAALPIVGRFLQAAVGAAYHGDFPIHRDVEILEVDPRSGRRTGFGCGGRPEVFIVGTGPTDSCSSLWPWASGWDPVDDADKAWWEELQRRVEARR